MRETSRSATWERVRATLLVVALALPASIVQAIECEGDASRTIFSGGDGEDTPAGACRQFDGNESSCVRAFHIGGDGIASCYYDDDTDACRGCGPAENELDGDCTNTCSVPACAADPTRTLFTGGPDVGQEEGACRTYDGDPSNCALAFHRTNFGGFASCWYDDNNDTCRGCGPNQIDEGTCTNTCATSPVCPQDPTRTVFVGGPRTDACRSLDDDPQTCSLAYHLGGDGFYSSCFPTVNCSPCGNSRGDIVAPGAGGAAGGDSDAEGSGCINECLPTPTCADTSKTMYVGGPHTDACESLDGNEAACNAAYHTGGNGLVASCWYDDDEDECNGCGPNNERDGDCDNTCIAHTCPSDPSRTIFAGSPGDEACRDLDETECGQAFHRGRDGIASCFWNGSSCLGCGPDHEEVCVNTCAPPPTCLDATRTNFVGGNGNQPCHQFDGNEAACLTAYHSTRSDLSASCFWDSANDLCLGCGVNNEEDGACTNTCLLTPTCGLDASRTIFAGGPNTNACDELDGDQEACESAFHRSADGRYTSCAWDSIEDNCYGCGPYNEGEGRCTNTCGAPPTCGSDPTRVLGDCSEITDPTVCSNTYSLTEDGPVACTAVSLCLGCGIFNEDDGDCTNTCENGPGTGTEDGFCDDGADNDDDGAIDCGDADCAGDPACAAPAPALSWQGLLAALLTIGAIALYRLRAQPR